LPQVKVLQLQDESVLCQLSKNLSVSSLLYPSFLDIGVFLPMTQIVAEAKSVHEVRVFGCVELEDVLLQNGLNGEVATFDAVALILYLLPWVGPATSGCHLIIPAGRASLCGLDSLFVRDSGVHKSLLDLAVWAILLCSSWNLDGRGEREVLFLLAVIIDGHLQLLSKVMRRNFP